MKFLPQITQMNTEIGSPVRSNEVGLWVVWKITHLR